MNVTHSLQIMDDYWELLPRYQGVEVDDLKFLRILYGTHLMMADSLHPLLTMKDVNINCT